MSELERNLQILRDREVKPDLQIAKVESPTKLKYLLSVPEVMLKRYWGGYLEALEVVDGWKVPDAGQHTYTKLGPIVYTTSETDYATYHSARHENTAATEAVDILVTEDALITSSRHVIDLPFNQRVEGTEFVDKHDLVSPDQELWLNHASHIAINWPRVVSYLGGLAL